MASSAKYTPAPTEEPHDDLFAPPPYTPSPAPGAASGSSGSDAHNTGAAATAGPPYGSYDRFDEDVLGAPRSSEDNLPDDFKFGGNMAEATIDVRHQFIRKVYAILSVQLLVTAAVSALSFMSTGYKSFIQSHPGLMLASLVVSLVFLGLTWWKRRSYPSNLLFLGGFTLCEAYTVSVIVSLYDSRTVLLASILTGGIFVFLTLFACQTKYDFTSWMPFLFGSLWGLVMFGFVAMFFPYSSTTELVYGGLGALVFSGYILVDTQLVLRKHHVEEEIAAAISLYLDLINLFLAILRILNSQNRD
jgi:FtsH-binding integral membrane protein